MMKKKKESAAKELSISTRFLNSTGEISQALYLATHPEEIDEAPRSTAP
jgi:hypothetical protein